MFSKKYITTIFSLALICTMLSACGGGSPTSTPGAAANNTQTGSNANPPVGNAPTSSAGSDSSNQPASGTPLLQIVNSSYYLNSDTKQGHVIGLARNISGGDLFDASVKVNLLDDGGSVLASGSSASFSAKLLPADAQGGFDIVLDNTPAKFAKMDFSFDGQPYSAAIQPTPSRNLVASDDALSDSGLGNMQVTSTITNKGSKAVSNVYVVVAFLDDSGNVLDVSELIAGMDGQIPAGGTLKSIVGSTRPDIHPTKYLLYVSGSES